jgi:hypothetical protein
MEISNFEIRISRNSNFDNQSQAVLATLFGPLLAYIASIYLMQVRKRISFARFYTKNASFYQDMLGTNIGKALKKEMRFLFTAGA